jgi:hypothetical protein
MSTMTKFRGRLATRRQRAEFERVLRRAEPRLRAELITIARRDHNWY